MEHMDVHVPVLADEVVFLLRARRSGWMVDGTVGLGGHAERLLEASAPGARLLGLDGDDAPGVVAALAGIAATRRTGRVGVAERSGLASPVQEGDVGRPNRRGGHERLREVQQAALAGLASAV